MQMRHGGTRRQSEHYSRGGESVTPAAIQLSIPKGLRRAPKRKRSDTYAEFVSEFPDAPKWAVAAASGLDRRLNSIEDRLQAVEQRVWIIVIALAVFLKLPLNLF